MKYELSGTTLKVIAEADDKWQGESEADGVAMASDGKICVKVLNCGDVFFGEKKKRLSIRLDTRPELQDLVDRWEKAKVDAWRIEEKKRKEVESRTIRVRLSSRGWGDYSALEWVGDVSLPTDEIVRQCRELLANGHDVDDPNQTDGDLAAKVEKAKAARAASEAGKKVGEDRRKEVAAKREKMIAGGARMATPKQIAAIAGAVDDWHDIFDGAAGPAPTDEELDLMTIEQASRLVGQIIAARRVGA